MKQNFCIDCRTDISKLRWNAKRCRVCSHKHQLRLMKKYRDTHKKEIKDYQKIYYGKDGKKK